MSFSLVKRMVQNRLGIAPERSRENIFPLTSKLAHLTNGCVLNFTPAEATLVEAASKGSLFAAIPFENLVVSAYGLIKDGGINIHKFYMETPNQHVLVVTEMNGIAEDIKLCSLLTEVNPSSQEEWDMWLSGVDGAPPLLTGKTLMWQGDKEFTRYWGGPADKVQPVYYHETIQTNDKAASAFQRAMLFQRTVDDSTDWLLLSVTNDGVEAQGWVEAYVGIRITENELTII